MTGIRKMRCSQNYKIKRGWAKMTDEKLIEHRVRVDKHMEVILKIPEVMDAIELEALMLKSRKLFSASNVPLRIRHEHREEEFDLGEENKPNEESESIGYNNGKFFTPEKDGILFRCKANHFTWDKIAKRIGKDKRKCIGRITYLKSQNKWNSNLLNILPSRVSSKVLDSSVGVGMGKGNGKHFTKEQDKMLFQLRKHNNYSWIETANRLGMSKRKCYARMHHLKLNGKWNESLEQ
jgi:hypothetical protein